MCYFYLSEGKIKVFRVRSVLNGYVGRTHIIVRFQTRSRTKHGTENFGGFIYVLDGFPQRDFVLWVFICPINIVPFFRLSIFRLPRQGQPRPIYTARATTPLPPLHSYHACVYIPATTPRATTPHPYHQGLSRLCIHPGYHTRAITLHHTSTSGYHTRNSSSYFIVYLSPAITPPVLLTYTTTGAPHATTYSTR